MRRTLLILLFLAVAYSQASMDSASAVRIDSLNQPLYNPFVERYILDEVKTIREGQIRLRSEVREQIASAKLENSDRTVDYATSTVSNLFYIITAAASIFVLVGWNSVRDVRNKLSELVDEKVNAITNDYEDRLNALDKRLKARSEEIIEAHEKIAKSNTIHALWMRSGLEITPQAKIDIYDEILKISPADVEALSYKADALLEENEPQWALSLCNKALGIDDEYGFAYWQRACAEAILGKEQEALSDIRQAILLSPDFADELYSETALESLRELDGFAALAGDQNE